MYMETRKIIWKNYKNALNGISLSLERCAFCVNLKVFLTHIVCDDGLLVDPHKIIIIIVMLAPSNLTKIKQFQGIASFYRCYFWDFASKARPMCKLLKKDEEFSWIKACAKSWDWMKAFMTCLFVLIVLDWKLEFLVCKCIKFCTWSYVKSKPR
jgi:hypothetical protein